MLTTMTEFGAKAKIHLGGVVMARSVKYLGKLASKLSDQETRDAWWAELRAEACSHARSLCCTHVLGYSETCTIHDDVIVLSCVGTAATIRNLLTLPDITAAGWGGGTPRTPGAGTPGEGAGHPEGAFSQDASRRRHHHHKRRSPGRRGGGDGDDDGNNRDGAGEGGGGGGDHSRTSMDDTVHSGGGLTGAESSLSLEQLAAGTDRASGVRIDMPLARDAGGKVSRRRARARGKKQVELGDGAGVGANDRRRSRSRRGGDKPARADRLHRVRPCSMAHVPYHHSTAPFSSMKLVPCGVCGRKWVPELILTTIEPTSVLPVRGHGTIVQARVCRLQPQARRSTTSGGTAIRPACLPSRRLSHPRYPPPR